MEELISTIIVWTPTHRHTNVCRSTKSYIHQLYADGERESRKSMQSVHLTENDDDPHYLSLLVVSLSSVKTWQNSL